MQEEEEQQAAADLRKLIEAVHEGDDGSHRGGCEATAGAVVVPQASASSSWMPAEACKDVAAGLEEGPEPVASISPEEAARIAGELWASGVARLASQSLQQDAMQLAQTHSSSSDSRGITGDANLDLCCVDADSESDCGDCGCYNALKQKDRGSRAILMTFNRINRELDEALHNSSVAEAAKARGVDVRPPWANGAKIFAEGVGPEHFDAPFASDGPRPWHLVIREEDSDEINHVLSLLPHSIRRTKPGLQPLPEELSLMDVSSEGSSSSSEQKQQTPNESRALASEKVSQAVEEQDLVAALDDSVLEIDVRRTFIHLRPRGESFDTKSNFTV
eukprot:gnl/TRDRNA2_/TRDRNA2_134476_c2_seq1.p1 gnl/TRDRNA2_/TRDRNA2_134476_c2~~gnl/TRDRNA2_/TRDRNA2_134476_c2_seq1.p1  ORF type:complete len:355 (-),score=60.16 gnl/TRDRNA2_/TRDRNA2_134476_c2_seq1:111-1109(-)